MKLIADTIIDETPDIRSFRFVRADGQDLPEYEPGAHIDVTAPSGITRQYSLCGPLDDKRAYTVAVKKEVESRGGSRSLHDDVTVGMELEIGAPRNLFALDPAAKEHLLFGAGIGVTPLLSMAYRLHATNAPFTLHYFVRSEEHAAFFQLMKTLPFAGKIQFHFGILPDQLPSYLEERMAVNSTAHVYTCGPGPFMDLVVTAAGKTRPEDHIHLEHFKAEPVAEGDADSFEVKLASSGKILNVPASMTILKVLEQEGIAIDTSCKEGICGSCVIPVLDGEPDHRDHCLSKKEKAANNQICTCVSRAKSAMLVLDL